MQAQDSAPPVCPASMMDTANRDPFPMLEEWRALGPVIRDEKAKAWIVMDHAICKHIEADEVSFNGMYANPSPTLVQIKGGQGNIMLSQGDEHERLRRFHMQLLSLSAVERYRSAIVRPVIDSCLRAIEKQGHGELAADLAVKIPPRVIFALFGMPWQEDALVQHTLDLHEHVMAYFGSNYPEGEIQDRALAASKELNGILLPYIRARENGSGEDLLSHIWREAPDVYGKMTEDIALGICRELFLGGSDTTVHGIANCFQVLLTNPDLRQAVDADRAQLRPLVEEAMRLYPAPQWRYRVSMQNCELGGVQIRAGDRLLLAHNAANRDPQKYGCPASADLTRKPAADHLAFNFGTRTCPGAGLARAEMRETLEAALDRLPNLRLDPNAEQPRLSGFFMTSFRPLNVLFDVPEF